ncbi:uncharacterized protein LOC144379985 isoform X1 [Halichoerus grypus]
MLEKTELQEKLRMTSLWLTHSDFKAICLYRTCRKTKQLPESDYLLRGHCTCSPNWLNIGNTWKAVCTTELFDLACRALKSGGREKTNTPADSKSFSEMPLWILDVWWYISII